MVREFLVLFAADESDAEGLRYGLVLSGLRRTGKTTVLRNDLIAELERQSVPAHW